jgi:hypothetical protein
MFSLHPDEEMKTALSKPTQTILLQCGERKSVMIILLRLTRKNNPRCTKTKTPLREKKLRSRWIPKGNKKEMDFHAQRNSQDA